MHIEVKASLAALVWIGLLVTGCREDAAPAAAGGLVVVVDTDLSLPRDIDRIRLEVTQGGRALVTQDHQVGEGHLLVPAEFRIKFPGNSMPVLVRGVAFKDAQPRIERSTVTPVPADHLGLVRLPLNYLCDGTARSDGSSTCGDGRTCKQGICLPATVPARDLPAYESGAMDGGAGGGCFDVPACFAHGAPVVVEEVSCSLALPSGLDGARINVGFQVPAGRGGVCDGEACWVVVDQGAEGWTLEGGRIRLPEGLCRPRPDGSKLSLVLTARCATKTAAVPACGGWSSQPRPVETPPPPPNMGSEACVGEAVRSCGACGTQRRACENGTWREWSACAGEGVCAPGSSQACGSQGSQSCGADCRWGACAGQRCEGPASRACGNCGTQTRSCDDGRWSDWTACGGQGACAPDSTERCGQGGTRHCGGACQWGACAGQTCDGPPTRACGNCGTQSRTCANGVWSDWSACDGQGACAPNAMQSCGAGGQRTCGGSCQWGTCGGQMCAGPDQQACGSKCGTQTRTCETSTGSWSAWSACGQEGPCQPGETRSCGNRGTQSCGGGCQWESACKGQVCEGASAENCGHCGVRTRTCDSDTGQWSAWSACNGTGVCAPDATQPCGNQGTRVCGGSCQWGAACTGQRCEPGLPTMACGMCGTRTRSCDGNTGTWSEWSECGGQGACAAGTTRPCGNGGTQTCGDDCQWAAACKDQMCPGSPTMACERCGTRTRSCDGDTGTWSDWSACGGQGVCAAGTTQSCGPGQSQTCTDQCAWGTCSCPTGQELCGGACVNRQSDSNHCGACGNRCILGNVCSQGVCTCPGASCPTSVAQTDRPWALAVDQGTVYFSNFGSSGSVVKVPPGGQPTTLASDVMRSHALAVAGGKVFFGRFTSTPSTHGGSVSSVPVDGGPESFVAAAAGGEVSFVAADASHVYFISNAFVVSRVGVNGGAVLTLSGNTPNTDIRDAVFHGGKLYWTNDGTWNPNRAGKVINSGMVATPHLYVTGWSYFPIASNLNLYPSPSQIAAVGGSILFSDANRLNVVSASGGPVVFGIATGFGNIVDMVVADENNLYVADEHSIYRMSPVGGPRTTIATGSTRIHAIAVDSTHVYWTDEGAGFVAKVAR